MKTQDDLEIRQVFEKVRARYTQRELASLLHYSQRHIARWEKGTTPIPFAVLPALRVIAERETKIMPQGDFTFIDLFSGIGGTRMGFELAGGRCVYACESDPYARQVYSENFPDGLEIAPDITRVDAEELPDHDVLLAGFPFQTQSSAGVPKKKAGAGILEEFESSVQNWLFLDLARVIAAKRPKAIFLENVKTLLTHNRGQTFSIIRYTLEQVLGYRLSWRVIDGRHFVPQHRERLMIAGFRDKTGFNWDALPLPEPAARFKDILHKEDGTEKDPDGGRFIDANGRVLDKYILTDKLWNYLQEYAAMHKAKGNGFGYSLTGPDDTARTLSARYYKDGAEILVPRGDEKPRRLTPRECARLMGFPDTFRISVSDMRAYQLFGNSAVMPQIKHAADLMKPSIMKMKDREKKKMVQGTLAL